MFRISRKYLEKKLDQNIKINVYVVGLCSIAHDITVELATKTINQFRVYGKKTGPPEVIAYLNEIRWNIDKIE